MFTSQEIGPDRSHSMEGDAAIAGVSAQSVGTASGVGQVTTPASNSDIQQENKYAGESCLFR